MESQPEVKTTETKKKKDIYNYQDVSSNKLSQEFKDQFIWKKGNTEGIKSAGLTTYAHFKGIKSIDVDILQYPTQQNNSSCICKATVIGYAWSPAENKIVESAFSDIGEACPQNCGSMVKEAFIRMASTRAISRALRKYTAIDMVSSDELSDIDATNDAPVQDPMTFPITQSQLSDIKTLVGAFKVTPTDFSNLLISTFNKNDFMALTTGEGFRFVSLLINKYLNGVT